MGVLQNLMFLAVTSMVMGKARHQEFVCPVLCICDVATNATRCRGVDLTNLDNVIIPPMTVSLDLSYNKLRGIPMEIQTLINLQYLYLQHNRIASISATDFGNLANLRALDLSSNSLANNQYIDSKFVIPLKSLVSLDLSNNPMQYFPNFEHVHSNLQFLNVMNCSISHIVNKALKGLKNIRSLNLSKNPFLYFQNLESKSLANINISDCHILHIKPMDLMGFPALTTVSISRNYQLRSFKIESDSITHIDLSDCNLSELQFSNMSKLTKLDLQGNRIATIASNAFQNIPELDTVILSNNAITSIDEDAFSGLPMLKYLDLSFNRINQLKSYTFNRNPDLIQIRLSHNYIKGIKLRVPALRHLDVSHSEIQTLSAKDLVDMPKLAALDLSHNWLSKLPNNLEAKSLKQLDVSMCGIWTLNNSTFATMPNLDRLMLQGNRLSSQIGAEVFHDIKTVFLGDNPWRCDCDNLGFRKLYYWLIEDGRATDYNDLICRSPVSYEGKHWFEVCGDKWEPQLDMDKAWVYTMVVMLMCGIAACILYYVLRSCSAKKARNRDMIVRQADRQEAQARLQRMRRQSAEAQEEVSRNAPDPRDTAGSPPTYDEAVLLPPVSRSTSSLSGVHSIPRPALCNLSYASTSALENNSIVPRQNDRNANKRRRRRRRSAALSSSIIETDTSKTTDEPESRGASIVTSQSPVTTEREYDNETDEDSSNIVRITIPDEYSETRL